MTDIKICAGITQKDQPCKKKATRGTPYCHYHMSNQKRQKRGAMAKYNRFLELLDQRIWFQSQDGIGKGFRTYLCDKWALLEPITIFQFESYWDRLFHNGDHWSIPMMYKEEMRMCLHDVGLLHSR